MNRLAHISRKRVYIPLGRLILNRSRAVTNIVTVRGEIFITWMTKLSFWLLLAAFGVLAHMSESALCQSIGDLGAQEGAVIVAVRRQVDSGNFLEAVETLTEMLQTDTHADAEVYRMLAFSQLKLGMNEDALKTCERGLAQYPNSTTLGTLFLSILHREISPEERRQRLEVDVERIPDSPILARALGEELLTLNSQDSRALDLLSIAVRLSPDDAEAHFFYGQSACFNQQATLLDLCIRELRRAYQLAPSNQQANMQLYTMIAVAEETIGEIKQAKEDFARAMAANKTLIHPSSYTAIKYASFLLDQNDRQETVAIVEGVLKSDSAYGPAHFLRATLLAEQHKKTEAILEAELALQDSRNSDSQLRTYHYFLCRTYFGVGEREKARAHENWLKSHPDN